MKAPKHDPNENTFSLLKVLMTYVRDLIGLINHRFSIVLIFLFPASSIFCQVNYTVIDSILTVFHNAKSLNGNVLIAEKGQITYNRSFGFANETTKEKLNENSVFGLASVSKQFTATAIVMLKEQGKLNYDDKITKYIPELIAYNNISIRNMLNHTSGLQDFEQLQNSKEAREYLSTRSGKIVITNKDVIAFFSNYKPKLIFNPGSRFEYCDIGYVFLGSIIERVSGLAYAEFLDKYIFKPLGMSNTFVLSPETELHNIQNYATGYVYSDSLKKYQSVDSMIAKSNLQVITSGPSEIYSTVFDLLKWDRALYSEQIVTSSSLKEIFEPAILNDHTTTNYGFGWFIMKDPNYGMSVYHTGGGRGFVTCIERNIDHDKTIIMLQNHNQVLYPVDIINRNLYNIPLPVEQKLSQVQLDALSGNYEIQKGFELKIWSDNGNIFAQATGQTVVPLFAENEIMLFAKLIDVKLQFEKNRQGKITCLYILKNGNKTRAEKK